MLLKQHNLLRELKAQLRSTQTQIGKLERKLIAFEENLTEETSISHREFTPGAMSRLLTFNRRMVEFEFYLRDLGQRESARLDASVLDSGNPMDDYEIDATLQYILREDDTDFDEDEDNILAERTYHLKRDSSLADGQNYREPLRQYPGLLNQESHCWLFHDLYDHSYGDLQPALDFPRMLEDRLRLGRCGRAPSIHLRYQQQAMALPVGSRAQGHRQTRAFGFIPSG